MTSQRALLMIAAAAPFCLAGGCYESPDATNYEPGVYKGKEDPLLTKQGATRDEELIERFNMVQTDR